MTKRAISRRERERARQRLVLAIVGTTIGVALLALLAGVLYDQVWLPSRPVAQVGTTSLTRSGYWAERRLDLARQIAQNLQFERLLGDQLGQLGGQIRNQITTAENQVRTVREDAIDQTTLNTWIDRQVLSQSAAAQSLQASDGEIAQKLVAELGASFVAPPPPPITTTTVLTPTAATSATATLAPTTPPTATATVTPTLAPTATPGGPTATLPPTETLGPTSTPAPTSTPVPTPLADVALKDLDGVIQQIYNAYTQELSSIDPTQKPSLSFDDFKNGLRDDYLRRVLTDKVQAKLVPEDGFTLSTDPSAIETRHILIAVTTPISETAAVRDAEFERRRPEAEAILKQLQDGADFETLAKEKSEDLTTKETGGALASFDKTGKTTDGKQFDPAFVQAALALQPGAFSGLIKTPFGWDIVQLVKLTVPTKDEQLREARTKAFDEWLTKERTAATIERFPAATLTPTPEPTAPVTEVPLPTFPLGGEPTPLPTATEVPSGTATLPDATPATPVPVGTVVGPGTAVPIGPQP